MVVHIPALEPNWPTAMVPAASTPKNSPVQLMFMTWPEPSANHTAGVRLELPCAKPTASSPLRESLVTRLPPLPSCS